MGEIAPSGRPPEQGARAAEARKVTGSPGQQRGGILFRIGLLLALVIPAVFASPWYVAYAAPLPDVSALDNDVPGDTLLYAADGKTVIADLHGPGYQHYYEPLSAMGGTLPEAIVAFAVERRYSKDRILEMYLNSVSFGNSAVGTAAASQIFFHKKTADLDIAQAAMLAGLVRGPTLYDPFTNWNAAKARQREVLSAM